MVYAVILCGIVLLPYVLGFSGLFYAAGATVLSGLFLAMCIALAMASEAQRNRLAGMTFVYSIFYLFLLFVLLPADKLMSWFMSDDKQGIEPIWTEELLKQRRKRAAIMAVALLLFVGLFFWVTLVKLGANVAARSL